MVVFQVSLNFDPVKEILKIRCHININEESDYSEEIHVIVKSFAAPFSIIRKKRLSCRFITFSIRT